jgi:hypothetical protein
MKMDRIGEHLAGGRFMHEIEGMTRVYEIWVGSGKNKGGLFGPYPILPDLQE